MAERSLARKARPNKPINIGDRFSKLVVLGEFSPREYADGRKNRRFHCLCDCGEKSIKYGVYLKSGRSVDCGCVSRKNVPKQTDESKKYGHLSPFGKHFPKPSGSAVKCKCDCGAIVEVYLTHLKSGGTKSCGKCEFSGKIRHGNSKNPVYQIWKGVIDRCTNPNNKNYFRYGGRGITICDRWLNSFEDFCEDVGPRPEGLSLDRINVNDGYNTENCQWATWKTQALNKTGNAIIEWRGKPIKVSQFSRISGITVLEISTQIVRGHATGEAIVNSFRETLAALM